MRRGHNEKEISLGKEARKVQAKRGGGWERGQEEKRPT